MKQKLLGAISVLILTGLVVVFLLYIQSRNEFDQIKNIENNQLRLYMTRTEVEDLYGKGPDNTPGCFGCEMNFLYPHLNLSGRYFETLDGVDRYGFINESKVPK